jgi:hypothetical protein
MTDRPYTDDDLRHEAARQLAEGDDLEYDGREDDDFERVGNRMGNATIASRASWSSQAWWHTLRDDQFVQAQQAIHDLIKGAADTSAWAVQLGAAGLTPHTAMAWECTTGGYDAAVQVATPPGLDEAKRDELLAAIQEAVTGVVCRVLGRTPAA